jgi:hypothetical protein
VLYRYTWFPELRRGIYLITKAIKNKAEGKGSVGKTRKRWLDDAENYLKKMGVRDWIKIS